jgi:hypothetical protein
MPSSGAAIERGSDAAAEATKYDGVRLETVGMLGEP